MELQKRKCIKERVIDGILQIKILVCLGCHTKQRTISQKPRNRKYNRRG
jgi:hypothetical protein